MPLEVAGKTQKRNRYFAPSLNDTQVSAHTFLHSIPPDRWLHSAADVFSQLSKSNHFASVTFKKSFQDFCFVFVSFQTLNTSRRPTHFLLLLFLQSNLSSGKQEGNNGSQVIYFFTLTSASAYNLVRLG